MISNAMEAISRRLPPRAAAALRSAAGAVRSTVAPFLPPATPRFLPGPDDGRTHRLLAAAAVGVCFLAFGGAASSADTAAVASSPAPPPDGAMTMVDGLLLSPSEMNAALGATAMTIEHSTDTPSGDEIGDGDEDCLAISSPAQAKVYAGSGWTALRAQQLSEPGALPHSEHLAVEAVVGFGSARQAAAFFSASTRSWPACGQQPFTVREAGGDVAWTAEPALTADGTLSGAKTLADNVDWICQRALTVAGNVAVDVETCSVNPTDPAAAAIAHQIAAKVGQ